MAVSGEQTRISVGVAGDDTRLRAAVEEFAALIGVLQAEIPREVLQLLLNVAELPMQIATVDCDRGAARAGDVLVRLLPSDRFLVLLTTLRARDFDALRVELTTHWNSPVEVDVAPTTTGEGEPGVNLDSPAHREPQR
jgi:hypothetical protein